MESESFKLEFLNGTQFSKTRDAIFHNSSKHCLTYYIEIVNVISPLIPPILYTIIEGFYSIVVLIPFVCLQCKTFLFFWEWFKAKLFFFFWEKSSKQKLVSMEAKKLTF